MPEVRLMNNYTEPPAGGRPLQEQPISQQPRITKGDRGRGGGDTRSRCAPAQGENLMVAGKPIPSAERARSPECQ